MLNFCKKILKDDLLYNSYINRNSKITFQWLMKRCIRVWIKNVLPKDIASHISSILKILYFKYHYFRPTHLLVLQRNKKAKLKYISIIGGFGDMLMLYPYLKKIKEKYTDYKLIVILNNKDLAKFSQLSFSPSRIMHIDGKKVDFVKEFLERNSNIDFINYGDGWDDGYEYAYPPFLRDEYMEHFTAKSFEKDLKELFNKEDELKIENFIQKYNIATDEKYITFYFKTSSDITEEVFIEYIQNNKTQKIIIIGSPSKTILNIVENDRIRFIKLINSYSVGLDTMPLLLFVMKYTRLFIGGRGGFEAFFLLAKVPSISIFDIQGKQEWENGLWNIKLWQDNFIKAPYWLDECNKKKLVKEILGEID